MAANYALVTGASYGLGSCFAAALAARGCNLLLTARSTDRLEALAARLRRAHAGLDIRCVSADLATPQGTARVVEAARGVTLDLLVNNAGLGSGGDFDRLPLDREVETVEVNARAVVELTHAILPQLRAQGRGAIVNLASTASFQPVPYMATYAATKAFLLHFSLALYEENRRHGVHVMALCPGPTQTHFFASAGTRPRTTLQPAEEVVALGLRGLDRRRAVVVCGGFKNRVMVRAAAFAPRSLLLAVAARVSRKLGTTAE